MNQIKPPPAQSGTMSGAQVQGWGLMTTAAGTCWILLAVLALAAGTTWRLGGFAPSLSTLFDGIGLGLFATALLLQPAWDRMLKLQGRHFRQLSIFHPRYYMSALRTAAISVPLALATAGVLVAYQVNLPIARLLTLDPVNTAVPLGVYFSLVLLISGPALICFSLAVLNLCRRWVGLRAGTALWLAVVIALNTGAIYGQEGAAGLSLGRLAGVVQGRLNLINVDPSASLYFTDLTVELLILPLAFLAACILLLTLSGAGPSRSLLGGRLAPGWLATVFALAIATVGVLHATSEWAANIAVSYPGDWQRLLCMAVTAYCLVYGLLSWTSPHRYTRTRAWPAILWATGLCLVLPAYTLPNLYAGQTIALDVAGFAGVCLVVCLVFTAVCQAAVRLLAGSPWASQLSMYVLVALAAFPIDPDMGSVLTVLLRELHQSLINPEYLELSLPMVAVLMLLLAISLWEAYKPPRIAQGQKYVKKTG